MLHVVVSDVQVDGEYDFTPRVFGNLPEAPLLLAAWLVEQQVEEVVTESAAQLSHGSSNLAPSAPTSQ